MARLLGGRRREAHELRLLVPSSGDARAQGAKPSEVAGSASPARREASDLRPLTPSERLVFIAALRQSLEGDDDHRVSERFARIYCRHLDEEQADEHVVLYLDGRKVSIGINARRARHFVYERVADIAPLLDHIAVRTEWAGSIELNLGDGGRVGQLSFCLHQPGLLIPDSYFFSSAGYETLRARYAGPVDWDKRRCAVLWRGATTGAGVGDWRDLQRSKLCRLAAESPPRLCFDVGFNQVVQQRSENEENEIKDAGFLRPWVDPVEYSKYKFHIDIDGNSNAWSGLFLRLLSGGLVFKVDSPTDYRQWYYPRLKPWLNYVPVDEHLSNLMQVVDWAYRNDARAHEIACAGRALAESLQLQTEADFAVAVIEHSLWRSGRGSLVR